MRLCKHCGGDNPRRSIYEDYFCGENCIGDHIESLRAQNAELLAALEGSLEIVQASIVNARARNEYPAIIANMEMKEAATRAALEFAREKLKGVAVMG